MSKIVFIAIILFNIGSFAQVNEFFTDSNLTHNPAWIGDIKDFVIANGKLQSAKPEPNAKFYLSTPNHLLQNTQWLITVDLNFNPSGVNYTDIFLASDDSNLFSAKMSGYFVRLGGTKDEICLYKKVNGTSTLLIDGADGILNKSSNSVKLKITCDQYYNWNLSWTINSSFTSAGYAQDSSVWGSKWFGLSVTQSTASFFNKHYFDDIIVAPIVRDQDPPVIVSAKSNESDAIEIQFNETLDSIWAKDTGMFEVYDMSGAPLPISHVTLDPGKETLIVHLKEKFSASGIYSVHINGAKDITGNTDQKKRHHQFYYVKPFISTYKDLIFTELFIDPVPAVDLPEKEFIEIFNRTENAVNLQDYTISDPSIKSKLPFCIMLPRSYLILCKSTDTADFKIFGKTLGLPSIPSLNNAEDDIRLYNKEMTLIDRVHYKSNWYKDALKDDGGYTLELKDPDNICLGSDNWSASEDSKGGTPGAVNSVHQSIIDSVPPAIQKISVQSANRITVVFNEVSDSASFSSDNFSIRPQLSVTNVFWHKDSLNKVVLETGASFVKNTEYLLTVKKARDCTGNESQTSQHFVISDLVQKGDIQLNEILFNPYPYGSDFIEIINNSQRLLDLQGWKLANLKGDTVANKKVIFSSSFILKPYEYLAITENKTNILNSYIKSVADRITEIKSLPAFPDDEGSVLLLNENDEVMDRFDYNQSMHSPFIFSKEGTSLEKINPSLLSSDVSSWTSASKESGYATPGYVNSQSVNITSIEDLVEIMPSLITPNQDGNNDIMLIQLKTDKAGSLRNVRIFDMTGRVIRHLERNNYASASTVMYWDGSDDANRLVPIGHYILWLEVIDKEGNVLNLKKRIAVAERF